DVTDMGIVEAVEESSIEGTPAFFGSVRVTRQVTCFVRKLGATGETIDTVPLALPPQELTTKALSWAVPQAVLDRAAITPAQVPGAAHAAEHAAIGLLPLIACCDRWDIGGVSTPY